MKSGFRIGALLLLAAMLVAASASAGTRQSRTQTFEAKEVVRVNTTSGDLEIIKSESGEIEVEMSHRIRSHRALKSMFRERRNSLSITENVHYSTSFRIAVPEGTEVRFESASGDFYIADINCDLDVNLASGDIDIENCTGRFDINTASGDIRCTNSTGEFELNTASGDVYADQVTLDHHSFFNTASGRVEVELAASPAYDIDVCTASGRATLDFGDNELVGVIEMESKVRRGRIVSPIEFDDEEVYVPRRDRDKYVRKWKTISEGGPLVSIRTASGKAVLKQG